MERGSALRALLAGSYVCGCGNQPARTRLATGMAPSSRPRLVTGTPSQALSSGLGRAKLLAPGVGAELQRPHTQPFDTQAQPAQPQTTPPTPPGDHISPATSHVAQRQRYSGSLTVTTSVVQLRGTGAQPGPPGIPIAQKVLARVLGAGGRMRGREKRRCRCLPVLPYRRLDAALVQ